MTHPNRRREHLLHRAGYRHVAGVDEAGRGAWAGPIVAAAVILSHRVQLPGVNDSKKLSAQQRERLDAMIRVRALAYQVCMVHHDNIDRSGIAAANASVLSTAVMTLPIAAHAALVDRFPLQIDGVHVQPIVHGDATETNIAAASILAKVARDRWMQLLDRYYPTYGFAIHKGYGTEAHATALQQHGVSAVHRLSFMPMRMMSRNTHDV